MKLLLKVIVLTMITSFPFSTNAGTYLDLQRALVFKQHGQYGKAFPILLQLSEDGFVRAQMELADMYFYGDGVMKNNDEAIYWACEAARTGEIRALKFRIKLALKTASDTYRPHPCS
jgi:TPR repeat protein